MDWLNYTFQNTKSYDLDWKRKIINSAKDGANIEHYIVNFEEEINQFKPDLVILSLGLNHIIPFFDKEKYEELLEKLIKMITSIGAEMILWSPYRIGNNKYWKDLELMSMVYKKYSEKFGTIYINMFEKFNESIIPKIFTFIYPYDENIVWGIGKNEIDYLHCNVFGNYIIATEILKTGFKMKVNNDNYGTMQIL